MFLRFEQEVGSNTFFMRSALRLGSVLILCGAIAVAQGTAQTRLAPGEAGDTPANAGPLASDLGGPVTHASVRLAMRRVADWQLDRMPVTASADWTFAPLYVGMMAVPSSVAGDKYRRAMLAAGQQLHWQPGPRVLHADDQAVGQMYLEQNALHHDPAMLAPIRARMEQEMATPDDPAKPLWWWCDALFMAPPILAELTETTHDAKYVQYMDHEWKLTSALLYDRDQHLFSRDATFLNKHEANGSKVYWSRGNGWVMAGLVRVIDTLPASSPLRPAYVTQLRQMAAAVAPLQGADGLWRPGLLDASSYPLPEVSGSAFITYALAYGVNHGLLPSARYRPVILKAWTGMTSHVFADGRLGCIQPIGAAPGAFTETSSYVYGVGAYLLAGSQVDRIVR